MIPIQMVDLKRQHERLQPEINNKILEVIASGAYINGPEVKVFENELAEYLNVKHVIACANGTDALQLAMMALDLKPGDEVITANFTYVATAEIIALLRLTPVLVDVNPETFNIDVAAIEKAITHKTKAIVPVHLFGQSADMEPIMSLANKHNLYVVEDNAQAIGAVYTFSDGRKQKTGTIGHIGTTSFFPSKNLGCMGDGGAIFTNDDNLAQKLRMIANHGQSKQYYHDVVGVNSRLDSIQAGVLRIKLQHLDQFCQARKKAADYYDKGFSNIEAINTPFRDNKSTHVFHQYVVKLNRVNRDAMRKYLTENNIPSNIYYPVPLHKQLAYKSFINQKDFPITEDLCNRVLALPIHTEFDQEQQDYIINNIIKFLNSQK